MWGETADVLLRGLREWRWSVQREGQAHSPTKSGWDSAVLEGLVQGELWQSECFEVLGIEVLSNSIPTIVGSA